MPSVAFTAGGHLPASTPCKTYEHHYLGILTGRGYLLMSLFSKDGTVLTWSARMTRDSSGDQIATQEM